MNIIFNNIMVGFFFGSLPVSMSSEISDLRNFWLHSMYACTE